MTTTRAVADTVPVPGSPPAHAYPPETQLDWLVRYLPIKAHLTEAARASLIEVGGGARGLGAVVNSPFVGLDVSHRGQPTPQLYSFTYDGGHIPFRTRSFHTAVSTDMLQRVPPLNRIDFLKELLRISGSRVILGFPTAEGRGKTDDFMRSLLGSLGLGEPASQVAHDETELPRAREVEAILDQLVGWSWCALPTTGDFVGLLAALADVIPGTAPLVRPLLQSHAAALEAWILSGAFGPANHKVYLIERRQPRAALVDLGYPATLITAITCPNCDGDIDVIAPGVRCRGCGAAFAPADDGVFGLHRTATAPRAGAGATLGITFTLAPDWSSSDWLVLVHNYLHAFPSDAPHRLWITVDPRQLSTSAALAMLGPLVGQFGLRPFAELLLSETPPAPGTAFPLSSESPRIFEYSSEWFRAEAEAATQPRQPAARTHF